MTSVKPTNLRKFVSVELKLLKPVAPNQIPKGNINMTGGFPDCCGGRNELWFGVNELRFDTQFLNNFSFNSCSRMFVGFNMATRRKPEFSLYVIDEQSVITVH